MSLMSSVFGSKPTVPGLTPIDYGQVQKDAVQQNVDVLPYAQNLATQTDTFNQAELNRLLSGAIPDISQIQKNISGKLKSESAGVLSPDVQAAVERSGVAASLGHAGGSMGGAWVARDIGRTSYDISNQALASTDRWLQTTRNYLMPQQFNVASMFVSPQQRLAQVTEERNMQFERNWLENQIKAMPDPVAHGVWQAIDSYIHGYGGANSYAPTQNPQMNQPYNAAPGGATGGFSSANEMAAGSFAFGGI